MSYTTQVFANGELVAQPNMDSTFVNPLAVTNAYFPGAAILGAVGNPVNNYNQVGTSNVFNFGAGSFRFNNQVGPIGSESYFTIGDYGGGSVTVTCPSGSSPQYYIVATLSQSVIDSNQYSTTASISATAMTQAQINMNPNEYVVICAITNTSGVYSVFQDDYCDTNYGYNFGLFPSIYNPSDNYMRIQSYSTINNSGVVVYQQQISSSDAANGFMEMSIETNVINGSMLNGISQVSVGWQQVSSGNAQPYLRNIIYTTATDNRAILTDAKVNTSNKLEYDIFLYSNLTSGVIDSGITLVQGQRPALFAASLYPNLPNLTVSGNSIMIQNDIRSLYDSGTGITGQATWNGSVWSVTLGGYLSAIVSGSGLAKSVDLNTLFGVHGIVANNLGPVSLQNGSAFGQVTGEASVVSSSTVLNVSASVTGTGGPSLLVFYITFQCASLT